MSHSFFCIQVKSEVLNCADLFIQFFSVQTNKCMVLNWSFGTAISVVRSITDIIYLLHMLLQVLSNFYSQIQNN